MLALGPSREEFLKAVARTSVSKAVLPTPDPRRGFAVGCLALAPLFGAYEWAQTRLPQGERNAAEVVLGLGFEALGPAARWLRLALLVACGGLAWYSARARAVRLAPAVCRAFLEGVLGALLMGPVLLFALVCCESWVGRLDLSWDAGNQVPALVQGALVLGGAAWEELVFRVGVYSLLASAAWRAARAIGRQGPLSQGIVHLLAALGSAALFAAFHLRAVQSYLGQGGSEYDRALMAWLLAAGFCLATIFRWRGLGVAGWTHALFNLFLWIGVDPDVLR